MKKLLGIGAALMLVMALVAVPVAADPEEPEWIFEEDMIFNDAEVEDVLVIEKEYTRSDLITNQAFRGAEGVTTVQQAAGNANALQSNVKVEGLTAANEFELSAQEAEIEEVFVLAKEYSRTDKIAGHAFQDATGITTVNMSSGNANILQSNVEVEIGATLD